MVCGTPSLPVGIGRSGRRSFAYFPATERRELTNDFSRHGWTSRILGNKITGSLLARSKGDASNSSRNPHRVKLRPPAGEINKQAQFGSRHLVRMWMEIGQEECPHKHRGERLSYSHLARTRLVAGSEKLGIATQHTHPAWF